MVFHTGERTDLTENQEYFTGTDISYSKDKSSRSVFRFRIFFRPLNIISTAFLLFATIGVLFPETVEQDQLCTLHCSVISVCQRTQSNAI